MRRRAALVILSTCALFYSDPATSAPPAHSAEYKSAADAYQRGEFDRAAKLLTALEKAGDANARGALGLMYLQGRGVPKSIETAERLSKSAALEGVPIAQHVQGLLNSEVEGRRPDYKEAIGWFTLAAEQGHLDSQVNLGVIYFQGQWVAQDLKRGLFWTQKAADQGFAPAQDNMGKLYREGVGTQVDQNKAAYWYSKAAIQGYARALNALGVMHIYGTGVKQSKVLAYAHFDIAGRLGDETARMNQAKLHPQLTLEERRRAMKLASDWKPGSPLPNE